MNARAWKFSLPLRPAALGAALVLAPVCASAQTQTTPAQDAAAQASGRQQVTQAMGTAEKPARYPTFKTVPPIPKNEPTPADWKAAVTALRGAGESLAFMAANQPWTPNDNGAWAERDRQIATPPPSTSTPYDPNDPEVAQIRARAMAPSRTH